MFYCTFFSLEKIEHSRWRNRNIRLCFLLQKTQNLGQYLSLLFRINIIKQTKQNKKLQIGIFPQTICRWLLGSGATHKPCLRYRRMPGTPQNLISSVEIRPCSAEESAMHTAVSKAITREHEHSLPTSRGCLSFIWLPFYRLNKKEKMLIKFRRAEM